MQLPRHTHDALSCTPQAHSQGRHCDALQRHTHKEGTVTHPKGTLKKGTVTHRKTKALVRVDHDGLWVANTAMPHHKEGTHKALARHTHKALFSFVRQKHLSRCTVMACESRIL
eukprot:834871-Pelagomonas_calceolata.AAC.1